MREFPDITIAEPSFGLWLYLLIPAALAVGFFFLEFVIEHWTEKRRGKPVVGVGFILMGIAIFVGAMSIPLIGDTIEVERTASAVSALEGIGFQEVRITLESGTFGAYYDGELMRGILVEDRNHPGTFKVAETPPPLGISTK